MNRGSGNYEGTVIKSSKPERKMKINFSINNFCEGKFKNDSFWLIKLFQNDNGLMSIEGLIDNMLCLMEMIWYKLKSSIF